MTRLNRPGRRRGDGEHGALTLMIAILFPVLVALSGLVIDGGYKVDALENAHAAAQEAARAGAGVVNQSTAYSAGTFVTDPAQATAAADAYLAAAGYTDYSVTAGVGCAVPPPAGACVTVRVSVTLTEPTKVLNIIGIDSMSGTGNASAELVTGVAEAG